MMTNPAAARAAFRATTLIATLLTLAFTTGCLPSRIAIDLQPSERELVETRLIDEKGGDKVALLTIQGIIAAEPSTGLIAGGPNPIDQFVARLERAAEDDRVRALLVRIDSPGGTVGASETLANEIARFRTSTNKPVVASLGEVATSGGYYVAIAADHVTAQRATITGSIGVIIPTLNVSDAIARIGIDGTPVTSGPNKALAYPLEPADPDHYQILQQLVDTFHNAFTNHVRTRRPNIDPARFQTLTDGRILSAQAAADANLIDSLGGLRDAFDTAKQLANLDHADLITYSTPGREPATLYGPRAAAPQTPSFTHPTINLLPPRLQSMLDLRPGVAHYIWTGAAP